MSEDLISRQAAIDAFAIGKELLKSALDQMYVVGNAREKYEFGIGLIESYIADMKELPSALPERKKGKWVLIGSRLESRPYACSECNYAFQVDTVMGKTAWNFCPNCGAEMCERGDDVEVTKRTD